MCLNNCLSNFGDCKETCVGNSTCQLEFGIDLTSCLNSCPCQSDCPTGCEECESDFCQGEKCRDPEANEDFIACEERTKELFKSYFCCICLKKSGYRTITNKFTTIAATAARRLTLLALVCVPEITNKTFKDARVNQGVHLGVHVKTTARIRQLLQRPVQLFNRRRQWLT